MSIDVIENVVLDLLRIVLAQNIYSSCLLVRRYCVKVNRTLCLETFL